MSRVIVTANHSLPGKGRGGNVLHLHTSLPGLGYELVLISRGSSRGTRKAQAQVLLRGCLRPSNRGETGESESLKIVIENIVFGEVFLNAYLATVSWVNMDLSLDWNLVASLKIRVIFLQANKAHSSCGVYPSISKVHGHDESN